jgi:RHS repeat-associated protein
MTRTDQRTGTSLTYGYDNIYQLLSATQGSTTTESYTYDIVGNRLSSLGVSPYTYNSSNELTALPSGSYTYDNNGNTKTKPDGTQYNWNFDNRLTQVVLPGPGGTVYFKYDPFGRRIQKAFTQGSTTTTTNYLYDGFNLLEEVDGAGNVLARYTQGPSLDEPLSMLRGGTTSYYQVDAVGSVSSLSNGIGGLANTYSYDSLGKQTASTGTITNPFQYTGREFDSETSLYFYRARYYDQNLGRFISEDRLRFRAGNDFYAYVRNSPVNLRDPSGNDPALDGMVQGLMNIFPGSQLAGPPGAQYMVIHKPCPEVARILEAKGYETGALPPFNNPFDHAGGFEFRTRGVGPGFHFRLPYPADPTDPTGMGSPLSPCPGSTCILDQFHIDPNNPLGGNAWDHFLDFIHSHGIDPEGFVDDMQQWF